MIKRFSIYFTSKHPTSGVSNSNRSRRQPVLLGTANSAILIGVICTSLSSSSSLFPFSRTVS